MPIDPFTQQPLRLKLVPDHILIYSVGPDGTDDGGSDKRDASDEPADITFTLTKPSQ